VKGPVDRIVLVGWRKFVRPDWKGRDFEREFANTTVFCTCQVVFLETGLPSFLKGTCGANLSVSSNSYN
jgi:hypothetical protein